MQMKRIIHYIGFLLFSAVVSCNGLEPEESPDLQDEVDVFLSVSAEPQIDISLSAAPSVKAGGDTDVLDDVVKNLWVIQYGGLSDSAELLGEPLYISDYADFDGRVKLVATDAASSIYFIANTFEPGLNIPSKSTVADLKSRTRDLKKVNMLSTDENGNEYPIFNGCVKTGPEGVYEGAEYQIQLKRNVAKASITVTNETSGTDAVTVKSVQLCNIPSVSYYLAGAYDAEGNYPSDAYLSVLNYDAVDFPDGAPSVSFVSYLPVNMRGTVSENASELYKNRYAPEGATHLLVSAEYKVDESVYPIEYRFYLGSDMVRDFNLKPNSDYDYHFTISSKGNADVDLRIEDWGTVDFSDTRYEPANCYILNPIPSGSSLRHFRIPIQRINSFWGTDAKREYEDNAELGLRGNADWKAWVLTSDFEIGDDFQITKSSGKSDVDRYFEVAVAPGTEGNVIVAVGPEVGKISWSWHLWITDYDPYECLDWTDSKDGQYVYPVENGDVHRYAGDYWRLNRSAYIMDRNLGALSVGYPSDNRGLLYFQFGRKDPFFYNSSIYKYPAGQTYKRTAASYDVANASTSDYPNAVAYSVRNPLTFIRSYQLNPDDYMYNDWTHGNSYNPDDRIHPLLWQDPHTAKGMDKEGGKSIFDPCPPGYSLPERYIWSDFRYNNDEASGATTNTFPNGTDMSTVRLVGGFADFRQNKGLQYWPYQGENVLIPDNVVFYPACGYIHPFSGNVNNSWSVGADCWVFLWSDEDESSMKASGMTAQNDHLDRPNVTSRGRGIPVRCITDR